MEVAFFRHGLSRGHAKSIEDVLTTPFLTSADKGREVEAQLCEFFDIQYSKLTNSWTNGALATLLAFNIGPGDEVIVPAMTFVATANVVELLGARPIFVDVDPATLLMDLDQVDAVITEKTKAVIPVHLYGQMLDVAELRRHVGDDIRIVEDCAHCFESRLNGERPGKYSDAAIFSFYATKNITCGEGGAIITNSSSLYGAISAAILHGMSAGAVDRFHKGQYRHWDMVRLGVKANLPDLLAALLPEQIKQVEARRVLREERVIRYENSLRDSPFRLVARADGAVSAHHLFPIHVPPEKRDRAIQILNAAGIGITVNYRAVHMTTYYREKYGFDAQDFSESYRWGEGTVSLPLYPDLPSDEQAHVIRTLLEKVVPEIK